MLPQLIFRTLRFADKRCIAKFCWNFGVKGMLSVEKFKRGSKRGEYYVSYHTCRPVGPKPNFQLALRPDHLVRVRRCIVEMRTKMPSAMIDAYYDDRGQALCPMSTGVSHHIGPKGDIEPCPSIQFAKESIHDERIAYQIRDDLSDIGSTGETNDLAGLRPSLLLAIAHDKAKDAHKELIASVWRRALPAGASFEQVEQLYCELGADTHARTLLETYKEEAIRCLADLENPNLKGLLRRVLGKIFNDVEIKGWRKEQEMNNRVRDGVRLEAPSETEAAIAM